MCKKNYRMALIQRWKSIRMIYSINMNNDRRDCVVQTSWFVVDTIYWNTIFLNWKFVYFYRIQSTELGIETLIITCVKINIRTKIEQSFVIRTEYWKWRRTIIFPNLEVLPNSMKIIEEVDILIHKEYKHLPLVSDRDNNQSVAEIK